jgi:hypothetical protein
MCYTFSFGFWAAAFDRKIDPPVLSEIRTLV